MNELECTIILRAGGVGKSCLAVQFVANKFIANYDPTLEDSYRKQMDVDGEECVLDIVDTAGQDDFVAIRESYYEQGEGFICVFDITELTTFTAVEGFHRSILRIKDTSNVPFLLVGNKCDVDPSQRKVSEQQAMDLATKLGNSKYNRSQCKN